MDDLILYIGNRRYSSWSLRPYLALAASGLRFDARVIELDQPSTAASIAAVNPAGRVPVLHHGALVVHDSLAICEYVAELAPAAGLWPAERATREREADAEPHDPHVLDAGERDQFLEVLLRQHGERSDGDREDAKEQYQGSDGGKCRCLVYDGIDPYDPVDPHVQEYS